LILDLTGNPADRIHDLILEKMARKDPAQKGKSGKAILKEPNAWRVLNPPSVFVRFNY
jgi:hypothetical protein